VEPTTHLAIIIPIYQPINGWEELLFSRLNKFEKLLPTYIKPTIHIVDDGSIPSLESSDSWPTNVKFLSYSSNKGKGYAIRFGMSQVSADIYLFTDIDLPYLSESMIAVLHDIEKGFDISLAKRQKDYTTQISILRKIISLMLRWVIKNIFGLTHSDTQGGLKAMNENGKQLLLKTTICRYLFDLEWILMAEKSGLKISSVPTQLHSDFTQKSMNYRILASEFLNFLKLLFTR
jgi:glycosyltransferase involved in cell wall biosynthesis